MLMRHARDRLGGAAALWQATSEPRATLARPSAMHDEETNVRAHAHAHACTHATTYQSAPRCHIGVRRSLPHRVNANNHGNNTTNLVPRRKMRIAGERRQLAQRRLGQRAVGDRRRKRGRWLHSIACTRVAAMPAARDVSALGFAKLAATSAPGLGSPLPGMGREWAGAAGVRRTRSALANLEHELLAHTRPANSIASTSAPPPHPPPRARVRSPTPDRSCPKVSD
jgi:hypothetical protein